MRVLELIDILGCFEPTLTKKHYSVSDDEEGEEEEGEDEGEEGE